MRFFIRWCFLGGLLLLSWATAASASLTIEINQGVDRPIVLAVPKFQRAGISLWSSLENLPQGISGVIQSDLVNSGRFRVLPRQQMPEQKPDPDHLNVKLWRKTGAEAIVVGSIKRTASGTYDVAFKLLDIFKNKKRQIVGQRFSHIPQAQLRSLAHHMSNLIYQAMTGVPGAFGTRIAYVKVVNIGTANERYALVVADADGYNPITVLSQPAPIMAPAWAPDAKQLAYISFENHQQSIWISNVVTGKRRQITQVPGVNSSPAWSPDGKHLVVALSLNGTAYTDLYQINLNNLKRRRLTYGYSINVEPFYAPDGKTIAFTSNRGGNPQVYLYNVAAKKIKRVTYRGTYNARPVYSPDGKKLVMMHREDNSRRFNIAVLDLVKGSMRILTRGRNDESPSISPNGQFILYTKDRGGYTQLSEVSIDGRIQINLPSGEGFVRDPAWGPFPH